MDLPLTSIDGYNIMPYRVLQHFSSVFGLVLLMYWILKWYKRRNSIDNRSIPGDPTSFWQAPAKLRLIAIIVLIITTIGLGLINGYLHLPETKVLYGMYGAQVFLRYAIVGAAGAFLISTIVLGVPVVHINLSRFSGC